MPTSAQPQIDKPKRANSIIVLVGLTIGMIFMGFDVIEPSLGRLDYLGVPYPHSLHFIHVIVACVALVICVIYRRSDVIVFLALVVAVGASVVAVPKWVDHRLVEIRITRSLHGIDVDALEKKLGFKILKTGDQSGDQMWVDRTPGHDVQLTNEVKRLRIWRP